MAPKIEKKYIKIGIASLAVVALVIGLSVGLTQSNKNGVNASASSSNANGMDYDKSMLDHCSTTGGSGKSGKSGGGSSGSSSGKSGKSGGDMSYSSGKSGKSGSSGDDGDGGSSSMRVPKVYDEEVDGGDMMFEMIEDGFDRTRRLVVPGTKDYVAVMDKNTGGKRRKLRTELIKGKRGKFVMFCCNTR